MMMQMMHTGVVRFAWHNTTDREHGQMNRYTIILDGGAYGWFAAASLKEARAIALRVTGRPTSVHLMKGPPTSYNRKVA